VKRKVSWRLPRPELGCRAKGKKKEYNFMAMRGNAKIKGITY
jgi:hypothetical protein